MCGKVESFPHQYFVVPYCSYGHMQAQPMVEVTIEIKKI